MNFNEGESILLTCSTCGKQFSNEKRYFGHLRIHTVRAASTELCSSSESMMDSVSNLRDKDVSYDSPGRIYKCSNCDDTFDRPSQLDYHRRNVHMREKSQICPICCKGFFRKNDLQTHLNIHLGTRQLECQICGRKFNHVSNLIRHCRIHAGSKPYPCTICGKRFTQTSSLARHRRIHIRESQNFVKGGDNDEEESKKLEGSSNLKNEKITNRRHYCRICGETFKFMILLRQHRKIHRSGETDEKMSSIVGESRNHETREIFDANTREQDSTNNSIGHHLMELAKKVNSIEIETEHDVSISDILSPYNCNDIELSNSDNNLEINIYDASSNREILEKDEFYIGIREPELDKEFREICNSSDDVGKNQDKNLWTQEKSTEMNNEKEKRMENVDVINRGEPPMLRLVKTDTGEQFYELVVDNRCDNFEEEAVESYEELFGSQIGEVTKSTELFDTGDDVCILEKENIEKSTSESSKEFLQFLPNTETHANYDDSENSKENENSQLPMVRLVQNEDGEQFFELIREPLEFEKHRTTDKNSENVSTSGLTADNSNIVEAKIGKIVTNAGVKREKKEISLENGQRVTKDRTRKFKCEECDKWFSTAYNYKQHAGTHFSDKQKFHCKVCGLSFAWKSTLNKHLAGNHRPDGPQKFVCEICPKVYSTLSQVNEHVKRDHLKERNHVCPLCGKSFFKKFDLKTHSRTHTKERPYICRACGKGFHHQSHIIRHERIHSGERPYECNICQRTFTQPGSLKSHRQRHRDVKIDILEYRMDEDDPLTLVVR